MQQANLRLIKFLVLFPILFWVILFMLAPCAIILAISFAKNIYNIPPFEFGFTLAQYKAIFTASYYRSAFWDSLQIAFYATVISLIIGYPIAYVIAQYKTKTQNILLLLVMAPSWTSMLIRIYSWSMILGKNGFLSQIAGIFNPNITIDLMNSKMAVIIGLVYVYLPFMILPIYSSIEKIDKSLIEAAQDLGCKSFKAFLYITLPLSAPGIFLGCVIVFLPSLAEFVIPTLLGGIKVINIGEIIWTEFFVNLNWPKAAAVTSLMILPIIVSFKFFYKNYLSKILV